MNNDRIGWIQRAYILAGGRSSRFGSPKGLVKIDGVPLIDKLCQRLSGRGLQPTIVAKNHADFSDFDWLCIEDEIEDAGPLHGIQRSLADCQEASHRYCWIMTCDLWDWNTAWEEAISQISIDQWQDCWAVLLDSGDQFTPFPGVYGVSALKSIQDAWGQGIRSLRSWQTSIHDRIVRVPISVESYPLTFNTPEELAKLRSMHKS